MTLPPLSRQGFYVASGRLAGHLAQFVRCARQSRLVVGLDRKKCRAALLGESGAWFGLAVVRSNFFEIDEPVTPAQIRDAHAGAARAFRAVPHPESWARAGPPPAVFAGPGTGPPWRPMRAQRPRRHGRDQPRSNQFRGPKSHVRRERRATTRARHDLADRSRRCDRRRAGRRRDA